MTFKEKKYVHILIVLTVLFILFHSLVWTFLTGKVFEHRFNAGELPRLSYKPDMVFPRESVNDLPVQHIRFKEYEDIDVLTIGDSFSNGFARGKNPFYQDYIASNNNMKVMNINTIGDEGLSFDTIIALYNSGTLDKLKPEYIILQAVERRAILRFSRDMDWNLTYDEEKIVSSISQDFYDYIPEPMFINKLNYNAVIYNILYHFDDNAFISKIYEATLSKDVFTGNNTNKLLFYYEDLYYIDWANKANITLMNDNLNKLQALLDKKGIKLYFMPAADKSNVYSEYFVNEYPKSNLFEQLREVEKKYTFIDTKKVLQKLVADGVKDVYYKDDTHWGYKGSQAIFDFYLNSHP